MKNKNNTMKSKVTPLMIESWVGDGFTSTRNKVTTLQDCFQILADVANRKYSPKELKEDIEGYDHE
jgi:hypothetical protein